MPETLYAWHEERSPSRYERRHIGIPSSKAASSLRIFKLISDRATILRDPSTPIFSSFDEALSALNSNNPSREVNTTFVFCPDAKPSSYSSFYVLDEPLYIGPPSPLELERLLQRYPALWVRAPAPTKFRYQYASSSNFYTDSLQPPFHLTTQTLLRSFRRLILSPTVSSRVHTLRTNKAARLAYLQSGGPFLPLQLFSSVDWQTLAGNGSFFFDTTQVKVPDHTVISDPRASILRYFHDKLLSRHASILASITAYPSAPPHIFLPELRNGTKPSSHKDRTHSTFAYLSASLRHLQALTTFLPLLPDLLLFARSGPPPALPKSTPFSTDFPQLHSLLSRTTSYWDIGSGPLLDLESHTRAWQDEPHFRVRHSYPCSPFVVSLLSLFSYELRLHLRLHRTTLRSLLTTPTPTPTPSEPEKEKEDPPSPEENSDDSIYNSCEEADSDRDDDDDTTDLDTDFDNDETTDASLLESSDEPSLSHPEA